jgi:2-desacetyl-2-hydroxyethyl bacteriochlorophyllide A dehydrogenase
MKQETILLKAAIWYGGQDIRIKEIAKPKIKKNEALVKVKAVGICGSELHAYEGKSERRKPPLLMGHEFSGLVLDVGENIEKICEGDKVVVDPIIRCGTCEQCRNGRSNICEKMNLIGLHRDGAFAEYVAVPAANCYKLPCGISFKDAIMTEPYSVSIHAVNLSSAKIGDSAGVVGDGIIGLTLVQILKLGGIVELTVLGHHDYRLRIAQKLGADLVINPKKESPSDDFFKSKNNTKADKVYDAVGSCESVHQSIHMVKKGGICTLVGMLSKNVNLNVLEIAAKEIELKGSYGYTPSDFKKALTLIGMKRVEQRSIMTHFLPLDEIKFGFETLAGRSDQVIKVVIQP